MGKTYGVPYMGSKSKIVDFVVGHLPRGRVLVDLFAGGCAVTHAALLSGKWERIISNDINPHGPTLFLDAIAGKYAKESRWISRETFNAEKDMDPYISTCWSFGNDLKTYMYAIEIDPWKCALHHAVFFGDYSMLRRFGNTDLCARGNTPGARMLDLGRKINAGHMRRYKEWLLAEFFQLKGDELLRALNAAQKDVKAEEERLRAYLRGALDASGIKAVEVDRHLGTNGMAGHYFGRSQWAFPTPEAYAKMQEIMPALNRPYSDCANYLQRLQSLQSLERLQSLQRLERLQSLQRLQSLERLQSLQRLERLESLQRLEVTFQDYADVEIPAGAVVYCDIPYENTKGYTTAFDHARFYEWAASRPFPVFISSYQMPEGFTLYASTEKRSLMSQKGSGKIMSEGLYLHKSQIKML